MVGMIFTACQSGGGLEEENGGTPQNSEITLSLQKIEAEFESAEYTISVTSPYSWSATSKNNWITINTKTGIAGTESLTFTIDSNKVTEERKGTIVVKNADYNLVAELYIIQGAFIPELTASVSNITTDSVGAEKTTTITSNISWLASCDADWVTLSQTSGKEGKTTLKVSIKENSDTSIRNTTIKVFNSEYDIVKEINVTQAEFEPTLEVSNSKLTSTASGETKSVTVTSNISWKATCDVTWVTLSQTSGYEGQTTLKVTTDQNTTTSDRNATIKLTNNVYGVTKEIKVTQTQFEPKLNISESQISYINLGDTKLVTIDSNILWNMTCDADWVTLSQTSGNKGEATIKITVPLNVNIGNTRSATIKVVNSEYNISKNITITQNAVHHAVIYTSTQGAVVTPSATTPFNQPIVANIYANGKGYMVFDAAITDINMEAFKDCTSLSSITLPESIKNFYNDAFTGCTSLKTVYYQGDLSSWCNLSFYTSANGSIGSPLSNGAKLYIEGKEVIDITTPSDVKTLLFGAFYGCTSLKTVKISDTVTSIKTSAFKNCSSLESVTLSNNISDIKSNTFEGCSSLKSIVIPDRVTKIDNLAFSECSSLTSVTIPDSVTSIGDHAFNFCSSLESVTIPDRVTSIGGGAFWACTSLTSVTIPDSVTELGSRAFACCGKLEYFYGKFASSDNRCLIVGNTLNTYAAGATMESYTIPKNISEIGRNAFQNSDYLRSITIPESVTSIGSQAFYSCNRLVSVYCKPTTPPSGGNNMFKNNSSSRKIYVPTASVNAYKAASYWSDFADYIVGYEF